MNNHMESPGSSSVKLLHPVAHCWRIGKFPQGSLQNFDANGACLRRDKGLQNLQVNPGPSLILLGQDTAGATGKKGMRKLPSPVTLSHAQSQTPRQMAYLAINPVFCLFGLEKALDLNYITGSHRLRSFLT
jgi:hypothetical protein